MTRAAPVTAKPQDYFDAAVEILTETGSSGLSVSELCRRVGVTSGSFYHHFSGLADLSDQFVDFWLRAQDRRPPRPATDDEEAWQPLLRLVETCMNLPHAAEAAFRAWSLNDHRVRDVQAAVDARRHANLADALVLAGLSPGTAADVAHTGMATLVGMQLLDRPLTAPVLRRAMTPLFCDTLGPAHAVVRWLQAPA